MADRYCSKTDGHSKYTLEIARMACDELDDCVGIEDPSCIHKRFYLCKKGNIFKPSSRHSCAYRKSGNQ